MCAISSFYSKQVNRGLNYRPQPLWQLLGTLIMRSRSVAPLSAQYQCDIMIAIYRISLSLAGNELGIVRNRPKQPKIKQMAATSRIWFKLRASAKRTPCGPNLWLDSLVHWPDWPPEWKTPAGPAGQWLMSRPGERRRVTCRYLRGLHQAHHTCRTSRILLLHI